MNYYRNIWEIRSHTLAPLTRTTPSKRNFRWTKIEQYAFEEIKRILARDNLLAYPDFNEAFKIHSYSSDFRLGAVISQSEKIITLYIGKITYSQKIYTVIERELVSIVEKL